MPIRNPMSQAYADRRSSASKNGPFLVIPSVPASGQAQPTSTIAVRSPQGRTKTASGPAPGIWGASAPKQSD